MIVFFSGKFAARRAAQRSRLPEHRVPPATLGATQELMGRPRNFWNLMDPSGTLVLPWEAQGPPGTPSGPSMNPREPSMNPGAPLVTPGTPGKHNQDPPGIPGTRSGSPDPPGNPGTPQERLGHHVNPRKPPGRPGRPWELQGPSGRPKAPLGTPWAPGNLRDSLGTPGLLRRDFRNPATLVGSNSKLRE